MATKVKVKAKRKSNSVWVENIKTIVYAGIIAVVAYLGFWCIGWLCAGFTRDA